MSLFCKHNWKELKHFEIPSVNDIRISVNIMPRYNGNWTRTYITDYSCIKCGKLKRFSQLTYNFE